MTIVELTASIEQRSGTTIGLMRFRNSRKPARLSVDGGHRILAAEKTRKSRPRGLLILRQETRTPSPPSISQASRAGVRVARVTGGVIERRLPPSFAEAFVEQKWRRLDSTAISYSQPLSPSEWLWMHRQELYRE